MARPSLPRCPSFTMFLVVLSSLPLAWSSKGRGVPGPLAPQETSIVPYGGSGQCLCMEGGICGESASLPAARPAPHQEQRLDCLFVNPSTTPYQWVTLDGSGGLSFLLVHQMGN